MVMLSMLVTTTAALLAAPVPHPAQRQHSPHWHLHHKIQRPNDGLSPTMRQNLPPQSPPDKLPTTTLYQAYCPLLMYCP